MKNTIRVHKKLSDFHSTGQVKTSIKQGSNLIEKANNALYAMKRLGNSASALAMMNADQIKTDSKNFSGWESLDVPGFGDGSQELARLVVTEFHSSFSILTSWMGLIMNQISSFDLNKFKKLDSENRPNLEIEDAVGSLRHLIISQGLALSKRSGDDAHSTSMMLAEKLGDSFKEVWEAQRNLRQHLRPAR